MNLDKLINNHEKSELLITIINFGGVTDFADLLSAHLALSIA